MAGTFDDTPADRFERIRTERARTYLTRVRPLASFVVAVAMFAAWLAFSDEQYARAGISALAGTAVAVVIAMLGERFGFANLIRVSSYADVVFVAVFVAQLEGIDVLSVAFLWPILVAAAFGVPRDAVLVTTASTVFALAVPLMGRDVSAGPVIVEAVVLVVAGLAVSVLGIDSARALRERESLELQLEEAQRLAQIGSFDFDPATDVARWSEELHRIFQVPNGVPLGMTAFLDAIVEEDRARVGSTVAAGLSKREQIAFDTTIRRGDGELRAVHVIGTPTGRADGQRVVGTVQDVTELRRLDAMRDEFVAAASHELRTPTSIVLGFATTLTGEWERLPERDRRRFVGEIEDAAMRLSVLIEDVLQVSQIESGNVRCQNEPFDLHAEVADLVRTWPGPVPVELDADDADGPIRAVGDAARTRQVLVNLLENAERHARDSSLPVRIRIGRQGSSVRAVVEDHGPGIPPEAHDRIFERFVRLGHDSTGTGLGLYISRRLAEAQGGSLQVESAPGRGAAFTFALPADPGTVDA